MQWPNNADGDVFRRLESDGFDFSKIYEVDFNIDFDHWPLSTKEIDYVKNLYPNSELIEPDLDDEIEGSVIGYVLININAQLTYEFVVDTQKNITEKMSVIGGVCESWGLFHGKNA